MNRLSALLMLCTALPLVNACTTTTPPETKPFRDDPLIGKIIRTADRTPISFRELMQVIASNDVVYLSEKHDNPMHHAIQHRIIRELKDRGRPPVIGFEFFAMNDTPLLLNFIDSGKHPHTKEMDAVIEQELRSRLGWDRQPDKMWAFYYGLLKTARDNGLTAAGLDLGESWKRRITRKGMADLTPLEQKLIFSTHYENPVYESRMKSIFKAVHCGMEHGKMAGKLYEAWTARNDKMALSITQLAEDAAGPVVVIMGNGHTEYGLGVMDRVKTLAPGVSQINVAMTEIAREPADLTAYLTPLDLEGFEPVPPADYLWLTQRVSYQDPCETFRESIKKMKSKKE